MKIKFEKMKENFEIEKFKNEGILKSVEACKNEITQFGEGNTKFKADTITRVSRIHEQLNDQKNVLSAQMSRIQDDLRGNKLSVDLNQELDEK